MKSDWYHRETVKTAKKGQKSRESGDSAFEIDKFLDLTGINAHPAGILITEELLLLRLLQTSIVQGCGVPLYDVADSKESGDRRFVLFGIGFRRKLGRI